MIIETLKSPHFANADHSLINCEIKHETYGWIPFTAISSDTEQFGRDLYASLIAGEHGEISAYEPPPGPTPEQLKQSAIDAVQSALDAKARTHGYDSILSLCTYATSTIAKFAAEGQAGVQWRDASWAALHTYQAEVEAGEKPAPTSLDEARTAALLAIPTMVWPQ